MFPFSTGNVCMVDFSYKLRIRRNKGNKREKNVIIFNLYARVYAWNKQS